MNRKKYWDESYLRYWEQRTSREGVIADEPRPPNFDVFEFYLDRLGVGGGDKVLEAGCGYGRLFGLLAERGCQIYGSDICAAMIEQARRDYGGICSGLEVGELESLPFDDELFDKVICWAVFDATYQKKSLLEINRVLRVGGQAMLTGKNCDYFDDDEKALAAEINARGKGHPNYFTDTAGLLKVLGYFGFKLSRGSYFLRRGDFGENKFVTELPGFFYEYVLCLTKTSRADFEAVRSLKVSDEYSRTFRRLKGKS